MNIIAGIYRIVNLKNNKSYIGSSKNTTRRWYIHKSALKNNRHHSIYLQRSWNKHGEQSFKFEVIKVMDLPTEEQLFAEELLHIKNSLPEYNVGGVDGGDNLTNNPNRDDIIKKITETLRSQVAKMSAEERKLRWGRSGKTNSNWKGGISIKHCIDCKCEIGYGNARCMNCSKTGEQNPFYGKTHTNEYKLNASKRMKGKLPSNIKSVKIEGTTYVSVAEAARKLCVCNATILFRIKSKYWDYAYTATSPFIAG